MLRRPAASLHPRGGSAETEVAGSSATIRAFLAINQDSTALLTSAPPLVVAVRDACVAAQQKVCADLCVNDSVLAGRKQAIV
jgi:hypothetical protein